MENLVFWVKWRNPRDTSRNILQLQESGSRHNFYWFIASIVQSSKWKILTCPHTMHFPFYFFFPACCLRNSHCNYWLRMRLETSLWRCYHNWILSVWRDSWEALHGSVRVGGALLADEGQAEEETSTSFPWPQQIPQRSLMIEKGINRVLGLFLFFHNCQMAHKYWHQIYEEVASLIRPLQPHWRR